MNNMNISSTEGKGIDATAFPKNLNRYFGSFEALHAVPREQLEALQLAVLKERFESLRDRVPMLKKLADAQKVDEIKEIDEVVPLLFSHTVYKSYPISLLEKNRFTDLTKWLGKLTTTDFTGIDVSQCQGIDEWIQTLDKHAGLMLRHTSGTSGAMSFIPRTARETEEHFLNLLFYAFGVGGVTPPTQEKPLSMDVVFPSYLSGNYGTIKTNDFYVKYVAGGDKSKLHVLYPRHQSSDMLFLAGRLAAAKANGELDRLELSPALLARKAEFEAVQQNMAKDLDNFMNHIVHDLKGKTVYATVMTNQLNALSTTGLERGLKGIFAPGSLIMTGGGAKGQVLPADWKEKAKEFCGVKEIVHGYGMSEVMANHFMCSHKRYHMGATAVLFILDPDTGAPLPRKGRQTGRAAFFDLMADTYWGGFVSGDEITVEWDAPCACGKKSVHISPDIERYSTKRGGDDKISCAAAAGAHDEALDFLMASVAG